MSIEHILLKDVEDSYAPPSMPCLQISKVDNTLFLTIVQFDETNKDQRFETIASVAIDQLVLANSVMALIATDSGESLVPLGSDASE